MWILVIEAVAALFLLVFIVWWTMYSGKKPLPGPREQVQAPEPTKLPKDQNH